VRTTICCAAAVLVALVAGSPTGAAASPGPFVSAFSSTPDRVWIGQDFWANPLQDWRIRAGTLECPAPAPNRSVFLLTRDVNDRRGSVVATLHVSAFQPSATKSADAWMGFRLAVRGRFGDYRDDAVYGKGIDAGLRADGRLFAGAVVASAPTPTSAVRTLRASLLPARGGSYTLTVTALDAQGREAGLVTATGFTAASTRGGLAMVCHEAACGVREWRVAGTRVVEHPDRAYGPVLFAQYTLSRRVLTLTAQLAPIGESEPQEARLSFLTSGTPPAGLWREAARAPIDPLARTATFRVERWDDTRDRMYRVNYTTVDPSGVRHHASFDGTIRRDPRDKPMVVVAAFTGNNDLGFPHADVVEHVSVFKPDFLAFTGDQIYEPVGGFGVQRAPLDMAVLDYLRKWFLFGWEYRDLLREIPSVMLPDDHDVYHGNVWGAGGRDANDIVPALQRPDVGVQTQKQDSGGYTMPVDWVNMVQRTQTSHLPPPVDPEPVARGIGVYFTEVVWGGVSFAVLEDRKWKSAPAVLLPDAQIVNGWARNPAFDSATSGDVPGAELLGPRQMRFLERWADDWPADVWMKAVISQTLFANVATLPAGARADDVTTKLEIQPPGGYAEGERPVQDHDSDGWPQSPRTAALRLMRKARAVHIAGDQHLGSTIQYGIDAFRDGPYAICVPSVANYWPRRWFPPEPGANRAPGAPRYTGDYLDGFGNKLTVLAVSNPYKLGIAPADINDRAPGYGIITFEHATHRITFANWPRWVNPAAANAKPYPGWPITIHQDDNAGGAKR
jgi:hypothetical protein